MQTEQCINQKRVIAIDRILNQSKKIQSQFEREEQIDQKINICEESSYFKQKTLNGLKNLLKNFDEEMNQLKNNLVPLQTKKLKSPDKQVQITRNLGVKKIHYGQLIRKLPNIFQIFPCSKDMCESCQQEDKKLLNVLQIDVSNGNQNYQYFLHMCCALFNPNLKLDRTKQKYYGYFNDKQICHICHQKGAIIKCKNETCNQWYHFPCFAKDKQVVVLRHTREIYCNQTHYFERNQSNTNQSTKFEDEISQSQISYPSPSVNYQSCSKSPLIKESRSNSPNCTLLKFSLRVGPIKNKFREICFRQEMLSEDAIVRKVPDLAFYYESRPQQNCESCNQFSRDLGSVLEIQTQNKSETYTYYMHLLCICYSSDFELKSEIILGKFDNQKLCQICRKQGANSCCKYCNDMYHIVCFAQKNEKGEFDSKKRRIICPKHKTEMSNVAEQNDQMFQLDKTTKKIQLNQPLNIQEQLSTPEERGRTYINQNEKGIKNIHQNLGSQQQIIMEQVLTKIPYIQNQNNQNIVVQKQMFTEKLPPPIQVYHNTIEKQQMIPKSQEEVRKNQIAQQPQISNAVFNFLEGLQNSQKSIFQKQFSKIDYPNK